MEHARTDARLTIAAILGALFLVVLALMVPIDHDEGQYLAATRLVAEGWRPYLDFPYLQTPLQPLLLAPLQWFAPGNLLIASRLANALLVALAAWAAGRTAVRLSGHPAAGPLAVALVVLCDSVQFAGSVARNDALPLAMFALGLERLIGGEGRGRLFVAGLALAAAASAKISYALPTAAVALVLLVELRRAPQRLIAAYAGMALGALPTLTLLVADPARSWFYMVDYSVDGVRAYRTLAGSLGDLEWGTRLARFAKFAAMGPLLIMLVAAGWVVARRRVPLMIGAVFALALIASLLPMPMYRQYLVPAVIPVVLVLAASGVLGKVLELRRAWLLVGLALLAVAGTFRSAGRALKLDSEERPLAVAAEARRIGAIVRAAGGRSIASLDSVRATDSGLELDRRLAPGPFLFRAGNLAACGDPRLCPLTFADLTPLGRQPPDAIVTGAEGEPLGPLPRGLDGALEDWAGANGYRPHTVGRSRLWLRP